MVYLSSVTPSFLDDAVDALKSLTEFATGKFRPTVRLGITGLSRSGKTVFTTALVHHLLRVTPLPVFRAAAEGRIRAARLEHQPDDAVARFPFEAHMSALADRRWPESTRRIAELRISIDYERASSWTKGPASLAIDLVDYPGEWLLDLQLLEMDFGAWSRETIAASRRPDRARAAASWHAQLAALDPAGPADEVVAAQASQTFRAYLAALRADPEAIATLPPGRFLMPGDLEGSPALTFAPLELPAQGAGAVGRNTLAGLMERRFESYRAHVVRPFFREHFARLDRQIVLIDVLAALDSGLTAVQDLEHAIDAVLSVFRAGRNSLWSSMMGPRIDRVLFAATKADHIHQSDHQRLEAILRLLVGRAVRRTEGAGGKVGTVALASLRATREARVREGGATLAAIVGTPERGEVVAGRTFDGEADAAIFPGELPDDPKQIFSGAVETGSLRFPRFRPPKSCLDAPAPEPDRALPHIRLDRALEFLLGDRLA